MKIYYGVTQDGMHLRASCTPTGAELTPAQRELLCEFFASLCFAAELTGVEGLAVSVPKQVSGYVLIRAGDDGDQHFVEYAQRESH